MSPSQDQVKSAASTLVVAGLSGVFGWVVAKGYVTQAEANAILSNQQFMDWATTIALGLPSSLGAIAVGVWRYVDHKPSAMIAAVDALPEVTKIELAPTAAGQEMAAAVPSPPGSVVVVAPRGGPR